MQHNIYVFQFLVPWRIEKLNTSLAAFMIRLLYTQYDIILMNTWFCFYDDFLPYLWCFTQWNTNDANGKGFKAIDFPICQ